MQAKGKKRMKAIGKVNIPQEAFMAVIRIQVTTYTLLNYTVFVLLNYSLYCYIYTVDKRILFYIITILHMYKYYIDFVYMYIVLILYTEWRSGRRLIG